MYYKDIGVYIVWVDQDVQANSISYTKVIGIIYNSWHFLNAVEINTYTLILLCKIAWFLHNNGY